MESRKENCTRWRTTVFLSLLAAFFLAGCGGPSVNLDFPLQDGGVWHYEGTMVYRIGKQEETMPPLLFTIQSQQLGKKPDSPIALQLTEEGEILWNAQLVKSVYGIVNPLSGEIWIPKTIKIGKNWVITLDNGKVKLRIHRESSITVPAGTFSAYLIHFQGPQKESGFFWLSPDAGMIEADWISKTAGGESHSHLTLTSYQLPENSE